MLGHLRHFGEIHNAGLGKFHFQFCDRAPQQREAGADDLPVFVGVARRRQLADGFQLFFKAHDRFKPADKVLNPQLLVRGFNGEAARDVEGLGAA